MQIKKYVASTLKEASEKMKSELGPEAIILGTRTIPVKTEFGTKKMFEITGGIEAIQDIADPDENTDQDTFALTFRQELENLSDKIFGKGTETEKSFKAIKDIQESPEWNDEDADLIAEMLHQNDVNKSNTRKIISLLKGYGNLKSETDVNSAVTSAIASLIPTAKFDIKKTGRPFVVSLVGPTGVGKTTCIAKLAIISKILHNFDIGLISIDTYRLGALDQLRIFSDVSQIDLLVAHEPSEIPALIKNFKKKDIIFIDTAGRSQKSLDHLLQTKSFLDRAEADETYLVMSSTTSAQNMYDVAERFNIFNYSSVIFTKLDEAVSYGNILNVTTRYNMPVMFLTNGQVIPDDIFAADSMNIASMIFKGITADERTA